MLTTSGVVGVYSPYRHVGKRERIERVLHLARHLPRQDRLLLEQVFLHGVSVTDICKLSGQSRSVVRRRIQNLIKRIHHPLFKFLVIHSSLLCTQAKQVAELVVFHGCSFRRCAQILGCSVYQVRVLWQTTMILAQA